MSRAASPLRRWEAVTASAMGASHQRTGLPNQDAVAAVEVGGGAVAVVADGHGGARYVRSDIGSAIAVAAAVEAGREAIARLGTSPATIDIARELRDVVPVAVVDRWRSEVAAHHAANPFTAEERERAAADVDTDPHMAYGATLVMALLGPDWAGLVQIGDGDLTVVFDDGRVDAPVPGDDRLVGGETTSLCLPTAVADARVAVLREPLPELVVLTSDGYANSFAEPGWRIDAGTGLLDAARRHGLGGVAGDLPGWLAESAAASGDDVSMALVRRIGPAGTAPADATAEMPAVSAPSSPATAVGPAAVPPRRTGLVMLAVIGALLAGAAAGWFAGRATADEGSEPSGDEVAGDATTIPPSVSVTEVGPTTSVPPAPDAVITVGNRQVGFVTDPEAPAARVIGWLDADADPDVVLVDGRWRIRRERLQQWRDGTWHDVDDRPVGGGVAAGGRLWLVDPDVRLLWSIDLFGGVSAPSEIDPGPVRDTATPTTSTTPPSTIPPPSVGAPTVPEPDPGDVSGGGVQGATPGGPEAGPGPSSPEGGR